MITLSLQDIRFLLSRSRGEWLPEELGGLAPLGPTGIRDVQGVGNNTPNLASATWWFGAADTLFPRLTFNRLLEPGLKNDLISAPFANAKRGPAEKIIISDTAVVDGQTVDALNPRNISNLIADSSNPVGFQSLDPSDPNYQAKAALKLMDDPLARADLGAINPLAYSNWMSQFGQFFDHGLDFVSKGVDGRVQVDLLPSDGLYGNTAGKATVINASRSNTANVTIGDGSTDVLLDKLGLLAKQGQTSWVESSTLTKPSVTGSPTPGSGFAYEGTLVLNNTLIEIAAMNEVELVSQINAFAPVTGVVASAVRQAFAIPGVVEEGAFSFTLTPAVAESFNQTSAFIDLSQTYGSDLSRSVFLREYLNEGDWQTATGNLGVEATITDLTTGLLVNAGATVNGIVNTAGIANWAQIKANASNVGITLHDADIMGIPLVAFDGNGKMILDASGMPQLVALNKVTGEIVYVKNTTLADDANIQALTSDPEAGLAATDFVLMTTQHAFLNDMGVRLPPLGGAGWIGRDLIPGGPTSAALDAHYIAGDGRLNENIGLTAVQEVFVNEHNRMIELLKAEYKFTGEQPVGGWTWTDPLTNVTTKVTGEELFQQAKLFNEMTYQHLVFDSFVRKLSPNIAGFAGVDPAVVPNISSEFANAVYRLGHSMLPEAVGLRKLTDASAISTVNGQNTITVNIANHGLSVGNTVTIAGVDTGIGGIAAADLNGDFVVAAGTTANALVLTLRAGTASSTATGLATDKLYVDIDRGLIAAFLNPQSYTPGVTAGLLADGSTAQVGNRIDEKVTDALRDNLLGQPLDLATLNLVRGRDAGLPTLNEMRTALQAVAPTLVAYTSWLGFRDNLKGSPADQEATVKNFIMAYASDAILTKFGAAGSTLGGVPGRSLADWYAMRESVIPDDQQAYMTALKAAAEAAYADATWMGPSASGNKDFNRIDAWMGGLAEREIPGGMLGETFDAVFALQMVNLQNGDHFYYLGRVPTQEFFIENMEGIQLSDIVMRATGATNLYGDIFSVADEYVQMDGAQQPSASLAALDASTTTQQVFDTNGNLVSAAIGRAGYALATADNPAGFYGNGGNYLDARGVLNPNDVGNESEMIAGTIGADTVFARGGNDTVRAGDGVDTIDGGSGSDFLYGGNGNDIIDGGSEDDFIYGEAGDDEMLGNLGIDTMFGGDGNDTMYGGADGDVMIGGKGDDVMLGGDGLVESVVLGFEGVVVSFDDPLAVGGILDPEPDVGVGPLDDTMNGGAGNDTLYGGGGWDALSGDSGHDTLIPGSGGADILGRESLNGGHGDDIYIVENAADFPFMDIDDTGLTQLELVNKDSYRQADGNGIGIDELRITDTAPGEIILAGTNDLGVTSIFAGIERVVIGTGTGTTADRSGTADFDIDASLANPGLAVGLEILGNAGVNLITGTAFDDIIDGGLGDDIMDGGLGNDRYVVSEVGDIVTEAAGGGSDTVVVAVATGNLNYTLAADLENLTLQGTNPGLSGTGNALDNVIIGSNFNNTLNGLEGNDTINGGGGFDTLTGGAGNDTFVFSSKADVAVDAVSIETITDFRTGGQADLIDLTAIDADDRLVDGAGHQWFDYANITDAAFTVGAAGKLRYANGILSGETNGDGVADFQIDLTNGPESLTSAMFVANPTVSVARSASLPANGLYEGDVGTVNQIFTVTLSRAVQVDTTFSWSVSGTGTNTADAADFGGTLPSGSVTILAGQTTGTITVPVSGDIDNEGNQTFQVALTAPTGISVLGGAATSTIRNDDAVVSISGGAVVNEGSGTNSAHTFTVSLDQPATVNTTVAWAVTGTGAGVANAGDFGGTALPRGIVTILAGQSSATFDVNVAGDLGFEADETFTVSLLPTAGLKLDPAASSATSTIANDDSTPSFSIAYANGLTEVGLAEGNAGIVNHTFTVTLAGGSVQTATTVNWAVAGTANAADFADGAVLFGTLTFPAGVTTQTITVPVRGDADIEANETFTVTLSNPSNGLQLVDPSVTSTILNDDQAAPAIPVISITGPGGAILEGNTGTSTHNFTVNLTAVALAATTVNWAVIGAGDASDFVGPMSGTVTIPAGQLSATIPVSVVGDTLVEANENFTVILFNPSAGTQLGTALATSTIVNDDVAPPPPPPPPAPADAVINRSGTSRSDTLDGAGSDDQLFGLRGNDVLNGKGGNDTLEGGAGNDTLYGGAGNDALNGGLGNDFLYGEDGNDVLNGGGGLDTLNGGIGNDRLIGSVGRDIMTGGEGADVFVFNARISEIGRSLASNDQIVDFASGVDDIDFSAIDANTAVGGDQAFTFIGSDAFSGAGQLRYDAATGLLQGNVNSSNAADFTITLVNPPPSLLLTDFIL